jgi:hypothetical protein
MLHLLRFRELRRQLLPEGSVRKWTRLDKKRVSRTAVQSRLRRPVVLVLAGVVQFGLFAALASAQLSPGPLSRAHQSLSGAINCTACHKLGSAATLKCLDCHGEIAKRLAGRTGLHATYNIPQGSS